MSTARLQGDRQGSSGDRGAPRDIAPEVALLAATALGFAYVAGRACEETNRLVSLADARPEALRAARDAVLRFELVSRRARSRAAELLDRAASASHPLTAQGHAA